MRVRRPRLAVLGIDVELDELGEDLLVVVLDAAEELPQERADRLCYPPLRESDELAQPAVELSSRTRRRSVSEAFRFCEISLRSV